MSAAPTSAGAMLRASRKRSRCFASRMLTWPKPSTTPCRNRMWFASTSSRSGDRSADRLARRAISSGFLRVADFLVPQRAAQDFADVGFRQLGAELDVLRLLVAGQLR